MASKKVSKKQKKSGTKVSKRVNSKKELNTVVKANASDQIYDFLEKLSDQAHNDIMNKEGTVGDFIESAVGISLSALYHSLFNLKFYDGNNEIIIEYVKTILEEFDADQDFPSWSDEYECDCGDICNECAAKMEEEASEKSKSALN